MLAADQRARLAQSEVNLSLLPAIEEAQALALLGRSVMDAIQEPELRTGWRSIKDLEAPHLPNSPDRIPLIRDRPLYTSTELYPNLARDLDFTREQFNRMTLLKRMPQRDLEQICRASIAIESGTQQALVRVLSARQQEA